LGVEKPIESQNQERHPQIKVQGGKLFLAAFFEKTKPSEAKSASSA